MKNIKCVIRKGIKTNDNEHLIYIRYTYNRRYILFRTDIYVSYLNWNKKSGRVRKSNNYELKNRILEKKEFELEKIILEIISAEKEPTLIIVKNDYYKTKNQFQEEKTKQKKHNEKLFLIDFNKFIEYRKSIDKYAEGTLKTYTTTYNKLVQFQKSTNYPLHYDTINEEFYYKFLAYLRKPITNRNGKIDKVGLLNNSVDKHIKTLKIFMKDTLIQNKHNNNIFQSFKRTRDKTDFVVLEADEIRKLYYDYIPDNKSHEMIRDAFIFGCSTGLRFSDMIKLTKGNFIITRDIYTNKIKQGAAYSYINISNDKKTKTHLTIPLNNFICKMIDKYNIENETLTFIKHNNQVFNKEIKKICRSAGITSEVTITKLKNTELIEATKPKCEFVTSHTMRRSFISILSKTTEISNIQAITGHKDIQVLADYIKYSDSELNTVRGALNGSLFRGLETDDIEKDDEYKAEPIFTNVIKTRKIIKS